MPVKKIILPIFIVLVIINSVLIFLYYRSKNEIRSSIVGETEFEIRSENSNLKLSFSNLELLEEYVKKLRVSDFKGIGVVSYDPYKIEWISPRKLIIVYSPQSLDLVDIHGEGNQPYVTFELRKDDRDNNTLYLFFNHDFDQVSEIDRRDAIRVEKALSSSIISILYRVTHYAPKGTFNEEEWQKILQDVHQSEPIVNAELL